MVVFLSVEVFTTSIVAIIGMVPLGLLVPGPLVVVEVRDVARLEVRLSGRAVSVAIRVKSLVTFINAILDIVSLS